MTVPLLIRIRISVSCLINRDSYAHTFTNIGRLRGRGGGRGHKGFVDLFYDVWIQKSHHFYGFWIQNFFCPSLQFLDPETAVFLQFMGPETAPFMQFLDCHCRKTSTKPEKYINKLGLSWAKLSSATH